MSSESTYAHIRTHILLPLLPYYYVLIALTAFYINPTLFTITLLLALALVVLVVALVALVNRHDPDHPKYTNGHWNGDGAGEMRSREDVERRLRTEVERLAHEERCTVCKERRVKAEFVRGVARRAWAEARAEVDADEREERERERGWEEEFEAFMGMGAGPERANAPGAGAGPGRKGKKKNRRK
ncbi:hypothetical protein EIP91_006427 [Steccherinum ochraceum]|uniref:Uncharacterized protein n=1 Tax=Steccherinum ochraceum TaxID=92696 RepID=A0A4R0RBH9_9APHY|nr:hypothetical protein EIP91_006427 [Steccherinum ochraceum]